MIKIILTGPESSGKSTLAQQLATYYGAPCLSEYSRHFLAHLERPYVEEDLVDIARGQLAQEEAMMAKKPSLFFCDTSLLVMRVWGLYKYGRSDDKIRVMLEQSQPSLFLLCRPDLPWEPDPLREHASMEDRSALFQLYHQEVQAFQFPYVIISGEGKERLEMAIQAVESKWERWDCNENQN